MNPRSYTAAGQTPWKLLRSRDAIVDGKIRPVHLQLVPTNRCDAKCPWCSCANEDRSVELGCHEVMDILRYFARLGTRAVTITGGGEPTLHPDLENIVTCARELDVECGLVTNGLRWSKRNLADLVRMNDQLTWARMSITDTIGDYDCDRAWRFCENLPDVDIGVSFTVAERVNLATAVSVCNIANRFRNVTHVRFVQDVTNPIKGTMDYVVETCDGITDKAIFQYRSTHEKGAKVCHISKLKPIVGADGFVYPCCGVQYSIGQPRKMPKRFRMCHWSRFHETSYFDGSICRNCHYGGYNEALANMLEPLEHERFV